MTASQIRWEYRQIMAARWEEKHGKRYQPDETLVDSGYEEWQKRMGIVREEG